MRVLTPNDMRRTEQSAFAAGMPSLILMEHAAEAVVEELEKLLGGSEGKYVLFLCGTGNNGGDGLAAARIFASHGGRSAVWLSGAPKTPDAQTHEKLIHCMGLPVFQYPEEPAENHPDAIVDALLGIGFQGVPSEPLKAMMRYAAETKAPVIAVDVPSGLDAETGAVPDPEGVSVSAAVTVTFHTAKLGLLLTSYRERVGKLAVRDIGLEPWDLPEETLEMNGFLPPPVLPAWQRPLNAHKGTCGRVVLYGGSLGMAGAIALAARAAVTAGAGLTTILCEDKSIPVVQTLTPVAMAMDIAEALRRPPMTDVQVLGCGLGREEAKWQNILSLWRRDVPSVWDADALYLLAQHPMELGEKAIMTPHLGEAARLLHVSLQEVQRDRIAAARQLARQYECTVVLKSDVTLVCDLKGQIMFMPYGTPALAKGGSGDVLTGMMGAVYAQMLPQGALPAEAAKYACLWHALAGRVGEKRFGLRELTAETLIACFREVE